MKILVVYTGGTIGSCKTNGYVSTDDSAKGKLIKRYNSIYNGDICFEEISPFTVLSENLSAVAINGLVDIALEGVKKDYDGIIITHGTDTLQYSACALSLALGNNCTPVMLVSSNYPLEDERANGFDNFVGAVEFIKAKSGRGVFVSYKNGKDNLRFHYGDRAMLHNDYTDYVEDIFDKPYAEYDGDKIKILNSCTELKNGVGVLSLSEYSGILSVLSQPGDSFSYSLDGIKAVIIRAYHSGTLNTENPRFVTFCKNAASRNIPIYLYNVPYVNDYDSMRLYDELGVIRLPICSFPRAYISLWAGLPI